eukprot:s878_g16.t1
MDVASHQKFKPTYQLRKIQVTRRAFAALLADGSVITWGAPDCGGDSSAVKHRLRNVQQIQATGFAFTALLADGSLVTWGNPTWGGDSSAAQTGRPASLEDFFQERQVFSCPGSRIDEDADVLAPRRMPYMPGEQLTRSAALGNQVKADEVKGDVQVERHVEVKSECSTVDTSSVPAVRAGKAELPVLRLETALTSVPLEERENYSMGSDGHDLRQCKPCAFFHTKGCSSGRDCEFCHLCPKGEKQRRQKEKRAFFGAMRSLQKIASESWPFRGSSSTLSE